MTATNATGNASQTFTVTTSPLTAPTVGASLADRLLAVRETKEMSVASGFVGSVDSYSASSNKAAVVTVSSDGSTLSFSGVADDTATITVTARNASGDASQKFKVEAIELSEYYCRAGFTLRVVGISPNPTYTCEKKYVVSPIVSYRTIYSCPSTYTLRVVRHTPQPGPHL